MKRWMAMVFTLLMLTAGCSATGPVPRSDVPGDIPASEAELRALVPEPRNPLPTGTVFFWAGQEDADLGVGYLGPAQVPANRKIHWASALLLPLFAQPGDVPWGWLVNGWLVTKSPTLHKEPFTTRGMVEVAEGVQAFVVLEKRDDGWFRLRYAEPDRHGDGTAWSHVGRLEHSPAPVEIELWREHFSGDLPSPLFYRRSDVRHALRRGPSVDTAAAGWIGASHDIFPLEVQGDWMKIRVTQPSIWCRQGKRGKTAQGWIQWRSADKGPWLWYRPEGCAP